MLKTSDLIHLPYTSDLSESGIAYACRWLAGSYDFRDGYTPERLRNRAGDVVLDLALRRYLSEQGVHFEVHGMTPFSSPEQFDIALGGHRCDVKGYPITQRSRITQLQREPDSLLQAPALVPVDKYAAEGQKPDDLYLFAFLVGIEAARQADMQKAIAAGQPVYLIHGLPNHWARPAKWAAIEDLALKSECEQPVTVEIGGQDGGHKFINTSLELPPRQRRMIEKDFHSLAYIHVQGRPEARIGIHCRRYGEPILIRPSAWDNLWFYGMEIILTGWLTHQEYRQRASVLNAGRRTFQYDETPEKNLLVPIEQLNPLGKLLEKVKKWDIEKRQVISWQ